MDVRIENKKRFTLVGREKKFSYENAFTEIPKFWDEFNGMSKCNMKETNFQMCWFNAYSVTRSKY